MRDPPIQQCKRRKKIPNPAALFLRLLCLFAAKNFRAKRGRMGVTFLPDMELRRPRRGWERIRFPQAPGSAPPATGRPGYSENRLPKDRTLQPAALRPDGIHQRGFAALGSLAAQLPNSGLTNCSGRGTMQW